MVRVHHILKDGTELENITGYVVRAEDCPDVYNVIRKISERMNNNVKCRNELDSDR